MTQRLATQLTRLKRRVQSTLRLRGSVQRPRDANPYATHLPVLIGIGQLLQAGRVLELGSGYYSTLTFLNRSVFPDLTSIDSYEDDPEWLEQIAQLTNGDDRLRLHVPRQSLALAINHIELGSYDLIFVDNATRWIERAEVISTLSRRQDIRGVVLIHDYEVKQYQEAALWFRHRTVFTRHNPHTAVVWNHCRMDRLRLRQLTALIDRMGDAIPLEETTRWASLFAGIASNRRPHPLIEASCADIGPNNR